MSNIAIPDLAHPPDRDAAHQGLLHPGMRPELPLEEAGGHGDVEEVADVRLLGVSDLLSLLLHHVDDVDLAGRLLGPCLRVAVQDVLSGAPSGSDNEQVINYIEELYENRQ